MSVAEDEADGLRRTLARRIRSEEQDERAPIYQRPSAEDIQALHRSGVFDLPLSPQQEAMVEMADRELVKIGGGFDAPGIGPLAMARWRALLLASTSAFALAAGWALLDGRNAR